MTSNDRRQPGSLRIIEKPYSWLLPTKYHEAFISSIGYSHDFAPCEKTKPSGLYTMYPQIHQQTDSRAILRLICTCTCTPDQREMHLTISPESVCEYYLKEGYIENIILINVSTESNSPVHSRADSPLT